MKKKLFALLLSLTLAAGLSACGGAPQSPNRRPWTPVRAGATGPRPWSRAPWWSTVRT